MPSTLYATEIKTFRSTYDGRKADRVSVESRELIKALSDVQATLQTAHAHLEKLGTAITGQSVMNAYWQLRSGRTPTGSFVRMEAMSLPKVYEEFLIWKKFVIVGDRRKRTDAQIASTTYETYPKRWILIQGYLARLKQTQLPVQAVRYEFATNLKEWLNRQRKPNGDHYSPATINKVISLLKMLMNYALSKGYIEYSTVDTFLCRGSSPANPKPLTKQQLDLLETCELPHLLRHICDSWLIAGELCLHYSDYRELPKMKIVSSDGMRFIQHDRSKQAGSKLVADC